MKNPHKTHFVYIYPSDGTNRLESRIRDLALNLREWYRHQMGNNKTFTLHDPIVEAYQSTHPASWYANNPLVPEAPHSEWYWANAQTDARDLAGAGFYQPFDTWVVYIDAPIDPDQHAGGTSGGFVSGLAVMHGRDCEALLGNDPEWTVCREVGGCGHELGHTFGLPHPVGSPDWGRAIMGVGYNIYPDSILTEDAKTQLDHNPFFALSAPIQVTNICPWHEGRPVPAPRPYPSMPDRRPGMSPRPVPIARPR